MKWKILKEGQIWESHEFKNDIMKMSIHHHIDHEPNEWILSCHDVFGSRQISLKYIGIEDAKNEAVELVRARLQSMLGVLD